MRTRPGSRCSVVLLSALALGAAACENRSGSDQTVKDSVDNVIAGDVLTFPAGWRQISCQIPPGTARKTTVEGVPTTLEPGRRYQLTIPPGLLRPNTLITMNRKDTGDGRVVFDDLQFIQGTGKIAYLTMSFRGCDLGSGAQQVAILRFMGNPLRYDSTFRLQPQRINADSTITVEITDHLSAYAIGAN